MAMIAMALAAAIASAPMGVSAPAMVRGDGRTPAVVDVIGPAPLEAEDPRFPDGGSISCTGAPALSAGQTLPPRILAPATATTGQLACIARRRGAEAVFSLRVEPPGPGLYAAVLPAENGGMALRPFRLQPGGSSVTPRFVHAAASAGEIRQATDGALRLALPPGRAPRAVAIALLDTDGAGAAFLPVPGRTRLRLQSKNRSSLSVRVAGAVFGPVQAPEGKANLSVLVPPGTRIGVVRAVDQLGNAREIPIDLETPSLPRIAAVASDTRVVAGGELRVAVALAAADGGPAQSAAVRAIAGRGSLEAPAPSGGGLWLARYRAPRQPGRDRIAFDVEGDPSAGHIELEVEVSPGPAAQISLQLPESPARAGDEMAVRAAVRDAMGNTLSRVALEATLGGAPARVSWEGAIASVTCSVPQRLPSDASVELVVQSSDAARAVARIDVHPAEASTAELTAEPSGRTARVRALVRDRFGNALGPSDFAFGADGATVETIQSSASGIPEANLEAAPGARAAETWVAAGNRVLARTAIVFDPPREAWLLFAWGQGGGMSNGGALRAPRFGAGIGIRRQFGPIEGALLFGADAFSWRDEVPVVVGAAQQPVSRRLFALSVPLLARARLPLAGRFGISLEGGPMAVFAWSSTSSQASGTERLVSIRPGARVRAMVDVSFGRGRIALGGSVGTARLVEGPIRGEIEGHSLFAGYEAWWLDIGP
ncbi:MAG: hypothetical protein E6J63_23520 [Deltaproteobacteria bacterium]|nr:MAG: hypothetical protein E6J63_23520 [Deltaproteobacteria bacterium]